MIDFSHHCYCLEGDFETTKKSLLSTLANLKFETRANPDLIWSSYDVFGINDAHNISRIQNRKAIAGERKVIVIETNSLTREAQNSLLKTFEEPSPSTHFFLIIPSAEILLDTLKSRMVTLSSTPSVGESVMGEKFLKASKKKRLEMVKEIADEKDKLKAINLLNQIEKTIYEKVSPLKPPLGGLASRWGKEERELMQSINKFRSYLNDRSPSIKMLLEHVALVAPKI